MARNVIPNDGRHETNELSTGLVVPIGAAYTEQASLINAESGGSGLRIDDADELIVRTTIVGTMPAGTEMVVTPIVPGFGNLPDITVVLGTVTDGTIKGTLKNNDNVRDASLLKVTYRFIQGGAGYTISAVNLQVRRAGAVGGIWTILTDVWNSVSRAFRTEEIDPLSQHYDCTSYTFPTVPNATPDFGYIAMDGYKGLTVHCTKTGTDTFDIDYEVSNEGYSATDDWVDATTNGFTLIGGADLQSKHFVAIKPECTPKGVRFEITTAGGSDDASFVFSVKKWY